MGYNPERALAEVVQHTHYLPRHWRGRGHTREVQANFRALFQYKVSHGTILRPSCVAVVSAASI